MSKFLKPGEVKEYVQRVTERAHELMRSTILLVLSLLLVACGARVPSSPPAAPPSGSQPSCNRAVLRRVNTIGHRSSASAAVGRAVNHHDSLGRLIRIEGDLDGDGQAEQGVHRTYDERGLLVAIEDGERIERLQYDDQGRRAVREIENRGRMVAQTVITYDEQGPRGPGF